MPVIFDPLRTALLLSSMALPLSAYAADAPAMAPTTALVTSPPLSPETPLASGDTVAPASVAAPVPGVPGSSVARFGRAADEVQLDTARGGTDIASDTRLQAGVSGNCASQMSTGANRIDSGSFAGAVGLPVVIQNTGANVLIQNATVINLQFK